MSSLPMHKECEGCPWNEYPICKGTIMFDGNFMAIDNLRSTFRCGQKNNSEVVDFSKKNKLHKKIEELEERIATLEAKKP